MQKTEETQVRSLGQEDPLEREMVIHSSVLAREDPMDREAWWAAVHRAVQSRSHLSTHTFSLLETGDRSWEPSWTDMESNLMRLSSRNSLAAS